MDLHYLKIFYEVAKENSFTRAAGNLNINQSAVSIQIKKFEQNLDIELFDRTGKTIKLTYAGEVLYKISKDIFSKVERANKEIEKIVMFERGKLIIGATPMIGEPFLPGVLKRFSEEYPEIEFEIHIQQRDILFDWLKSGKIDIILMGEFFIKNEDFSTIEIKDYPYVLVTKNEIKDFKELEDMHLVSRNDSILLEKNLKHFEKKHELKIKKRLTVNGSVEAVKNIVVEGIGFGILPYFSVIEKIKNGDLNVVEDFKDFKTGFQAVIPSEIQTNPELIRFLDFIKKL